MNTVLFGIPDGIIYIETLSSIMRYHRAIHPPVPHHGTVSGFASQASLYSLQTAVYYWIRPTLEAVALFTVQSTQLVTSMTRVHDAIKSINLSTRCQRQHVYTYLPITDLHSCQSEPLHCLLNW